MEFYKFQNSSFTSQPQAVQRPKENDQSIKLKELEHLIAVSVKTAKISLYF